MEDEKSEFNRAENSFTDIEYLISVAPEEFTNEMRKNFLSGVKPFFELLSSLQVS